MNEQDFRELSAAHALGALEPDDEARFAAALAEHPEWRWITDEDRRTAAHLAELPDPATPDPRIRAGLLESIAEAPQVPQAPQAPEEPEEPANPAEPSPPRRRRLVGLFALAACIVVLVGIGVGPWIANTLFPPSAEQQALERVERSQDARSASSDLADGGSATAHWSAELGTVVLEVDGLPALTEDETYELWYVRGETPVSAGTFSARDGAAVAVLDGEMSAGDVIAVTVEPSGGSPTGAPTSEPLFAIATA